MSETDIYKKREAMPVGNKPPKKKRRRRSSSQRAFDDRPRKRRSKNSGVRRMLHLTRKSENEKVIWSAFGVVFVVMLVVIGIWQFLIREHVIREQERADDYIEYQPNIPRTSDEPLMSSLTPEQVEKQAAEESATE